MLITAAAVVPLPAIFIQPAALNPPASLLFVLVFPVPLPRAVPRSPRARHRSGFSTYDQGAACLLPLVSCLLLHALPPAPPSRPLAVRHCALFDISCGEATRSMRPQRWLALLRADLMLPRSCCSVLMSQIRRISVSSPKGALVLLSVYVMQRKARVAFALDAALHCLAVAGASFTAQLMSNRSATID